VHRRGGARLEHRRRGADHRARADVVFTITATALT
jgi:hypothetical protein